jgi:TnpA family transposase
MTNQRLRILTEEEIEKLYACPKFTDTERRHFFSLPTDVLNSLKIAAFNGKNTSSKLYFILQYGYFKAKHQFYNIKYTDIKNDVSFIINHFMPNDDVPTQLPTRKIQTSTTNKILQLMQFSDRMNKTDTLILEKAGTLAKITQNPQEIFEEVVKYLEDNKMVLPSYSRLQDNIGAALKDEDRRIIKMIKINLTQNAREALQNLFKSNEAFYHITELKFDAKSFQTQEIKNEINKLAMCKPIYDFAKCFLPKLSLSRRMIDYYSDLAKVYSVSRLKDIPKELAYLYLICYVQSRCERFITNLIQAFIYYVDKYHNDAKKYAKNNLPVVISQLDQHKTSIGKLMEIYTDKKIMRLPGNKIQKHAFGVMPEDRIIALSQSLLGEEMSRIKQEQALIWQYHKENYQSILINLRPLFLSIDFEGEDGLKKLLDASQFFKSILNQEKTLKDIPFNQIPIAHIRPKALLDHFIKTIMTKNGKTKKVINPYQYEFYLYRSIRENIKKSKVHVNNSIGYKSFEAEVKIDPHWNKKKDKILKDLNNKVLLRPIDDTLDELEKILEPLIERTNKRALNGDNKHIKLIRHRDGTTDWTIPYPKKNDEIDNQFYDQLEVKTISEVFDFVEQECHFMKAFTHIKPRGAKSNRDYLGIKATVLANATMQGTHLFSKRSNLKYQRLQTAEQNHVRLETLHNAADIIVDCMVNLPIFDAYDLSGKKHGSGDGTKKKTRRRILKARHSPKYFGLDIGLVVMTMTLGHVPFVTGIIGANEHESHYIYPMLRRNNSSIDPDIISTDTAGANNVNDFLYYLIDKIHAPCYRSIGDKADSICGFKLLSQYKNLLITPSRRVNRKLIKKYWKKLIPILVSLLSHETSQENIIKKLSSHEYKSEIKDALWELNHILKSIYILKYIDDPIYRRDIRKALNRGEAYHQLIDKIAAVGGGDFRGMSDLEVEIWNECNRLIALIIIYYNMHLLSKLYEMALLKGDKVALNYLKHISPVASQHINISGLYEFSESIGNINVDNVVETLSKILENALNSSSNTAEIEPELEVA